MFDECGRLAERLREVMVAEKASMLMQKVAKESFFGVEIMKRFTPGEM